MNRYRRIGCALLVGLLVCGVLAVAAPQQGRETTVVQQAEIPTLTLTADAPADATLQVAGQIQLEAEETDGEAPEAIVWQSEDAAIASVSEGGLVTAQSEGQVAVTGTDEDGTALVCSLTVSGYAVTDITLHPASDSMHIGDTQTIAAQIAPDNATDPTLTWSSSDTDVLTVAEDGVVTAVRAGTADIRAQASNGYTVSCTITVLDTPALMGLTVSPEQVSLQVGQTQQLAVHAQPQDAETGAITWTSHAPGIATVDARGEITAVAAGQTTITAQSADGHTASCTVTVQAELVITGIALNHTTLTLKTGETAALQATIFPAVLADTPITWTSSNTAVARVDGDGVVTARSAGMARITAAAGGKQATCQVTVPASAPTPSVPTTPTTPDPPSTSTPSTTPVTPTVPSTPAVTSPGTTTTGGILTIPGAPLPLTTIWQAIAPQYTMPEFIPTAAFLTFDSDFGADTESILTALVDANISATFFVPIDDLYAADDMLRHMAGDGHSIGFLLTPQQAADGEEAVRLLNEANERLAVIAGTPTRLVRVSGGSAGSVSGDTLDKIQAAGYRLWDWNDAARETSLTVEQSYQSIAAALNRTGTVTVQFGTGSNTTAVLEQLLPYMKYCAIPAKALHAGDTPICQVS